MVSTTTIRLGRAGGAFEAEFARERLGKRFSNAACFVMGQILNEGVTVDGEAAFLGRLSDEIEGKEENWSKSVADVSRFGSASASMMSGFVRDFENAIGERLRLFVETEVQAGKLKLPKGNPEIFSRDLVAAANILS